MTTDTFIFFYTKKNPKKYEEIIKEYEKEIDEKLPNISTVMGIHSEPRTIFGEEYYHVGIATDYNPYASYFYEEDGL